VPRLTDAMASGSSMAHRGAKLNAMCRLFWIFSLVSMQVLGQNVEDAAELLRTAAEFAENTKSWRAEVVETSQLSGRAMNLQSQVRIKIAAQPLLKMSRQNSGDDRTIMVCDGAETFYSGDGVSYYKGNASVTPQCDLPLSKFYDLAKEPTSVSVVGDDHVLFANEDRRCAVVRATWKQDAVNTVRTMCIDVVRPLVLRDVLEQEDEKTGMRSVKTTTFSNFEIDPVFPPDAFRFSIPPGAVEAKRPN
jgi:outer membrane lipoprotein-sorting protein